MRVSVTSKKGTMPSRAMACSSRGAPVRLCSPAPQQEKNEPITITHGDGHDKVPITKFFFTESPNLVGDEYKRHEPEVHVFFL